MKTLWLLNEFSIAATTVGSRIHATNTKIKTASSHLLNSDRNVHANNHAQCTICLIVVMYMCKNIILFWLV